MSDEEWFADQLRIDEWNAAERLRMKQLELPAAVVRRVEAIEREQAMYRAAMRAPGK